MSLQQQMRLFQEGGLEQDGNTVDPVSGNDVPLGSSQEEVRDDIPAQLSEGEFVFPADVVRFIGLEKLMMIRQEAKAGLRRMEEMGQMGNSEEATMPDDVPFTLDDLEMEDDEKVMAEGGVIKAAEGIATLPSTRGFRRVPEVGINPPSQNNIVQNKQATFMNAPTEQSPTDNIDTDDTDIDDTEAETDETTFKSLLGESPETYDELRKYVGPNGEIRFIAFKDGIPLPAYTKILDNLVKTGYTYEDPATVDEEEEAPRDVMVDTAQVRDREGDSTDPKNMRNAENNRIRSFKNTIEAVMKEKGITDPAEAAQYIKNGNHKIKGIKVPGFLFKDFNLTATGTYTRDEDGKLIPATYGLDDAVEEINKFTDSNINQADYSPPSANQQFVSSIDTPAEVAPITTEADVEKARTGEGVLTAQEQKDKAKDRDLILKMQKYVDPKTQKMKEEGVEQADVNKAIEGESERIKRLQKLARTQLAAKQQKENIRDADRAARDKQQKELDDDTREKIAETRRTGRITGFNKGGIASKKPKKNKKKTMKRGGLASKK